MTKQEKMNFIYKYTGIEPNFHVSEDEEGQVFFVPNSNCAELTTYCGHCGGFENLIATNPHYPAEQLWEILPDDCGWAYYIPHIEVGYLAYIQIRKKDDEVVDRIHDVEITTNIADALLDMTVWCIQNGYVRLKHPSIDHRSDAMEYIAPSLKEMKLRNE